MWFLAFLLLLIQNAFAAPMGGDIGVNGSAGFPDLLGIQFRYRGVKDFEFGIGYGFLPINAAINSAKTLNAVPLALGLSDSYSLVPRANYALTGFSLEARYYPAGGGLYTNLKFNQIRFSATLSGDLRNDTQGTTSLNAVTGSVLLSQPMLGPGVGYQFLVADRFYIDGGFGLGILLPAKVNASSGGTASALLPLAPEAEENFNSARDDIQAQASDAVKSYQEKIKVLPTVSIAFGVAF